MPKITKQQAKLHAEACEVLEKDTLGFSEREFVLANWRADASHMTGVHGAFFTPESLSRDVAIEISGRKIIDLCAGIGRLAYTYRHGLHWDHGKWPEITCVEFNRAYYEVGCKVLPEATWIHADVLTLKGPQNYDCAISNPPFGRIAGSSGKGDKYTGSDFEYKVIEVASRVARDGVFVLPQNSCPFKYSGQQHFEKVLNDKYERFREQTGIELEMNCGLDTSHCKDEWHGVSPVVEIALATFAERERDAGH